MPPSRRPRRARLCASCGAILWLTPPRAEAAPAGYWRHSAATLRRPFTPDAFADALARLGACSFDPLARPHVSDPQEIEEIGV
ncbi:MAG TPA: hypothetical protein VIG30_15640 [Ktedonobacterales bacterium]